MWEISLLSAVQHERGPRKPKLQHLHNQMAHQQHHHHHQDFFLQESYAHRANSYLQGSHRSIAGFNLTQVYQLPKLSILPLKVK